MSAFIKVDVEFADLEHLLTALETMGIKRSCVEVNDIPVSLYGYRNDKREQKAEVVIRRQHLTSASNDMGFFKNENGKYTMYISQYDQGAVPRKLGLADHKTMVSELKSQYVISRTTAQAKALGGHVTTAKVGNKTVMTVKVMK